MQPVLIIITGIPASGKTTLARAITNRYQLPLLQKDIIKETLYDSMEHTNNAQSPMLGGVSLQLIFTLANTFLSAGQSVVLESNFHKDRDFEQLLTLINKYQPNVVQIVCKGDSKTLFDRFKHRATTEQRHPVHTDPFTFEQYCKHVDNKTYGPFKLDGTLIELETTDFTTMNTDEIYSKLDTLLQ